MELSSSKNKNNITVRPFKGIQTTSRTVLKPSRRASSHHPIPSALHIWCEFKAPRSPPPQSQKIRSVICSEPYAPSTTITERINLT